MNDLIKAMYNLKKESNIWNTDYVSILEKGIEKIKAKIPEIKFHKVIDSKFSGPRARLILNDLKTTIYFDGYQYIVGDKYQSYSGTIKEIIEYLNKYRKLDEEFINNINDEEPPTKEIYHFTSDSGLYSILRNNKIHGNNDQHAVSLTSDESYGGNGFLPYESTVGVLVLDAKKLSKDYTLERYVYDKDKGAEYDDYVNEHEWIIKGELNNIKDYILFIGDNGLQESTLADIKKDFPNIRIEKWE